MRTVVIWDSVDGDIKFFITEEDVASLDRVYIGSVDTTSEQEDKLNNLTYDEDGKEKVEMLSTFPVEEVRNGASVIICGFLP